MGLWLSDEEEFFEDEESESGSLNARERKCAELILQGKSNEDIAKDLEFHPKTVEKLRKNPLVLQEIRQIKSRIYEETVTVRLKRMAEPALTLIEECLRDKRNRFKDSVRIDTAKWLVEKLDGKATQKVDVGENLLGVLMDRLDAIKSSGSNLLQEPAPIDVTPTETQEEKQESDPDMIEWVKNFSDR